MSKHEHTPGPWIRKPGSTNIETDTEIVGTVYGGGWHLALVFSDGGIGTETAEANARLIAAAPDMLEALENLENDNGTSMPPNAWALVQAAIAKTRGR